MTASPDSDNRATLLRECRTVMAGRIRRSMGAMMREANDVLSDLAFRANGNVADSPYFDAIREIQLRRRELEMRFESRFSTLFEESLHQSLDACAGAVPRHAAGAPGGGGETPDDAVSRTRAHCRATLMDLDRHVSELLHIQDMVPSLNPMRPELVYEAFRNVCSDIRTGNNIQTVLLDLFERCVAGGLENIYSEVNTLLERGAAAEWAESPPEPDTSAEAGGAPAQDQGARMVLIECWVASAIERHTRGRRVPHFAAEFIDRYWRILLQRVYLKRGADSPDWDRAIQTLDELVLSLQDPEDPDARRRMTWLLPGLVYRLKSGMRTISVPALEQRLFLKTLKTHHLRTYEQRLGRKTGDIHEH